jgi:phosphomevalonate kinase
MRSVAAPGKLLLSGAYAVLHGAPAIVCAVDRRAYARRGEGFKTTEVAALGEAICVDVDELASGGRKVGLGSSAAALVAALGVLADERGESLADGAVRDGIFERARSIHARVQGGGSGVDVAASTYGGVLRFDHAGARSVSLPANLTITALFSGVSARTSDLLARVTALLERDPARHRERIGALTSAAVAAATAVDAGDAVRLVSAVAAHRGALEALGAAADAPIVLPAFSELGRRAEGEGAAFIPSGAGGGDLGVFVGMTEPSASFKEHAERLSMTQLSVQVESRGVRLEIGNAR